MLVHLRPVRMDLALPAIQFGAVLSVILWVPSFIALLFARRVISSGSFARGFGG